MVLSLLLSLAPSAQAGPWIKDQGSFYARVGYDYYRASTAFDSQGQRASMADERFLSHLGGVFDHGTFSSHTSSFYGEVGLGWHLEAFGSIPVSRISNQWSFAKGEAEDILQTNAGFGDVTAGLRLGGNIESFVGSIGAAIRAPLYDNNPELLNQEAGNTDFYDDKVPLGQGTIDVDIIAAGGSGWSLKELSGWASFEQTVRIRNRDYATAFPGMAQLGVKPLDPLAVMLNVMWQLTANNGEQPDFYFDDYGKGPTIIDRQHYLKTSLAAMFDVREGLALEASIGATLLGTRTAAGWNAGLGVSFQK
jgi:hypothetical protein